MKRIIESRDDVKPLLESFNIEVLEASTDEDGKFELGEKYQGQEVTIAVLENCSHPEDQVFDRMHPDGEGKCRRCGKIVELDEDEG